MVYDFVYFPSGRYLISNFTKKGWDLSEREHELLMTLIVKEFISLQEFAEIFTGYKDESDKSIVRTIKSRVCKKTGIKIKTKRNYGYRLISKIELKEKSEINGCRR